MTQIACENLAVLTDAQAKLEASRCLMCENPPCVEACPASVPVKHFIRAIRFDAPRRAINLIRERNVLAGVCGLACPVDEMCVGACRSTDLSEPIAIGRLQHYAAMKELESGRKAKPKAKSASGKKVAIIGAGPSGLAAAAELARQGHKPTIFEKNARPGGICTYGVHSRRVPRDVVGGEIEFIRSLGVEIETDAKIGGDRTLDSLFAEGFAAVYVATGLQEAASPGLPGQDLKGVTTWKAMLEDFAAYGLGERAKPHVPNSVIVIGGGSVAMDAAAAVQQLGASDIDMVCLESPKEMPAYHAELDDAWEEGVRFHTRSLPLEITGENGKVTGLRCVRIRWKEPNKFIPSNAEQIAGTEYWLPAEMVVFAIGARAASDLGKALNGVECDKSGRIVVHADTGATSHPRVFAGGDVAIAGGTTIVKAVAEGKRAAAAIADCLRK